jgi:Uma2 family endonuclease
MVVVVDEPLYEVVDHKRVEIAPKGAHENFLATTLAFYLQLFARPRQLGRAGVEVLYNLAPVQRERRPDVSFLSSNRWPYNRLPPRGDQACKIVPNLAAEVVSATNTADEILIKIHEYFQAGVELVWVVNPDPGEVYVYESPQRVRILTRADTLDAGTVLPGFQLALTDLFEEEAVANEN